VTRPAYFVPESKHLGELFTEMQANRTSMAIVIDEFGGTAGLALGIGGLHWVTNLPRVRGFIEAEVTTRSLLEVLAVVLVLGVLGSLYPAWRAARLNTVDALRHE